MTSLLEDAKRMWALQYGDIPRLQHIIETLEQNKMLYVSDRKYLHKLTKDVPDKNQASTIKFGTEKTKKSSSDGNLELGELEEKIRVETEPS